MNAPSTVALPEGMACLRCGGGLDSTVDESLLHCRYCGTDHQVLEEESVPASMPARWDSSRDAREALRSHLRERGIKKSVTAEVDLHWLVFWRIRAKLVGWQFYQKRPDQPARSEKREDGSERTVSLMPAERVEELVARDVDVTLPGCDSRAFDLVGISDRVDSVEWVPFSSGRTGEMSHVASVAVPRRVALRRAELLRKGGLVPRGATGAVQRLSLLRSRSRLLYYPVWRLHFTVSGRPGIANIDAVRSKVLGGQCVGPMRSPAPGWYAAAGAAGWMAGIHPALAAFSLAGWVLHRGGKGGASGGPGDWGRWVSEELGPHLSRPVRLDQ
ncbi:hypothetical protein DRQ32_01440 [bacterium]|nr:MAG: hypothetical protein DRQ32_01440 [bacterium]